MTTKQRACTQTDIGCRHPLLSASQLAPPLPTANGQWPTANRIPENLMTPSRPIQQDFISSIEKLMREQASRGNYGRQQSETNQ